MTAVLARDAPAGLPTAVWRDWSCLVRLVVTEPTALQPAVTHLRALMARVDRAASRFRPDSELCRANAQAGRPVAVSRLLVRLVQAALEAAAASGGAVDPTVGRQLARLGYDRDITLVTGLPDDPGSRPQVASWRDVRLDQRAGLVTVPAGTALDLGATAKAQTADWAATELAERFDCSVLVELGGDLAVAGDKDDWQITVAERRGGPGQQIQLHRGGLATSTTTVRSWPAGGGRLHHIIDPSTGRSSTGRWRTVSVAAESAVRANTCSTAAIVLGDRALGWLTEQHVPARLVGPDASCTRLGGWPC
ncbi:MAG TPA: FAD:protein FMN transferase [Jatrophihabitans sp.]|nr:FAD:protein FMN transferase [Jatrophihabitans sp.]